MKLLFDQNLSPRLVRRLTDNCTTGQIEEILRRHYEEVKALDEDPQTGVLSLF